MSSTHDLNAFEPSQDSKRAFHPSKEWVHGLNEFKTLKTDESLLTEKQRLSSRSDTRDRRPPKGKKTRSRTTNSSTSSASSSLSRGRSHTLQELSPLDHGDDEKKRKELLRRLKDFERGSRGLRGGGEGDYMETGEADEVEDKTEFWSSLYAQHPVLRESQVTEPGPAQLTLPLDSTPDEEPLNTSTSSTSSNDRVPQSSNGVGHERSTARGAINTIKVLHVLRKFSKEPTSRPGGNDRHRNHHCQFESLSPDVSSTPSLQDNRHFSAAGGPFSFVLFFTVESALLPIVSNSSSNTSSNNSSTQSRRGGKKHVPEPSILSPPTAIWLSYSNSSPAIGEKSVEFMGAFQPNNVHHPSSVNTAWSSNISNHGSTPPFYIYETRALDLGEKTTGLGGEGFQEESLLKLDLLLTASHPGSPPSIGPSAVTLSYIFERELGRSRITKIRFDDGEFEKDDELYFQGRNGMASSTKRSSKSKDQKRLKAVTAAEDAAAVVPVSYKEPDTGEHLVQATSEFFSKMGYWLYNSKMVQLIARDDRVRTKTSFSTREDIWMLGVCYSFQPVSRSTTLNGSVAKRRLRRNKSVRSFLESEKSLVRKNSGSRRKPSTKTLPVAENSKLDFKTGASVDQCSKDPGSFGWTSVKQVYISTDKATPDTESFFKSTGDGVALESSAFSKTGPTSTAFTEEPEVKNRAQHSRSFSYSNLSKLSPPRSPATSSVSLQGVQSESMSSAVTATSSFSALSKHRSSREPGTQPIPRPTSSAVDFAVREEPEDHGNSSRSLSEAEPSSHTNNLLPNNHVVEKEERTTAEAAPPSPRKMTRQRMTISGLFSWDGAKADTESPPMPPIPQVDSVSVLKSIVAESSKAAAKSRQQQSPQPLPREKDRPREDLAVSNNTITTPATPFTGRRPRSAAVSLVERSAPPSGAEHRSSPPSSWGPATGVNIKLNSDRELKKNKPTRVYSSGNIPEMAAFSRDGEKDMVDFKVGLTDERKEALSYIRSGMGLPRRSTPKDDSGQDTDRPQSQRTHNRGHISQRSRSEGVFMDLASSKKTMNATTAASLLSTTVTESRDSSDMNRQRGPASMPASNSLARDFSDSVAPVSDPSIPVPKRSWRRSLSLSIASAKSSFPSMGLFSPTTSTPPTPAIPSTILGATGSLSMSLPRKSFLGSRSRTSGVEDSSDTQLLHDKMFQDQDLNIDVVSLPASTSAYLSLLLSPPMLTISPGTSEDDTSTGTATPNEDNPFTDKDPKRKGTIDLNGALIAAHHFQKQREQQRQTLTRFMMDFQSRLWFTYRKDLSRIEPSFYTCDSGWGCMMRTGQSLLAQAFVQVMMGREWRVHLPQPKTSSNPPTEVDEREQKKQRQHLRRYRRMLGWFCDEPAATSPKAYYSIHGIAKEGLVLDKKIGEWFGPATVAHALQRLSVKHHDCPLQIVVNMDGCVRFSTLLQAAATSTNLSSSISSMSGEALEDGTVVLPWIRPVLLLLPTRFGLDKVTESYRGNLKRLFRVPQFLGIAGGRPGRSLYFVASQGDDLYYYDPHFVKTRVPPEDIVVSYPIPSFHCGVVRSMDIQELDPSMLLGFLVRSLEELQDLKRRLDQDMERRDCPLVTLMDDLTPLEEVQQALNGFHIDEKADRAWGTVNDETLVGQELEHRGWQQPSPQRPSPSELSEHGYEHDEHGQQPRQQEHLVGPDEPLQSQQEQVDGVVDLKIDFVDRLCAHAEGGRQGDSATTLPLHSHSHSDSHSTSPSPLHEPFPPQVQSTTTATAGDATLSVTRTAEENQEDDGGEGNVAGDDGEDDDDEDWEKDAF